MSSRWLPVGCALALAACAPAASPPTTTTTTPVAHRGPLFEMHSDPWVNLHQRLLAEATSNQYWHSKVETCACARAADGSVMPEWTSAVAQYKKTYGERNHYADSSLMDTNLVLGLAGASTKLPSGVDKDLATPLSSTFEAYLRGAWSADDARNQAWTKSVEPLVAKWGDDIASEIARRFETHWPSRPIRVEITQYAGFGGAYTTNDTAILTTMSSEDAGYVGPAALEMLFHEAMHGLNGVLVHDLQAAFMAKGKRTPQSLDHAIIFYTAGELTRRRLGADYVPYATAQGVWRRGWQKLEAALRVHWQPWLDDQIDLPTAIDRLVAAFDSG